MSTNTTGNKFYEIVIFDKGSLGKGRIVPSERGKVDLGTPSLKFDNVYANNIEGGSGQIRRGTWRPVVRWSIRGDRYVRPTFSTPTVTTIEAKYERIGNRVFCFYYIRVTLSIPRLHGTVYSSVGGLPFEIYQRVSRLDSITTSSSAGGVGSNFFVYDYTRFLPFISRTPNMFANWADSTRRSVVQGSLYAISFSRSYSSDPSNRYYYARFAYRTR